MPVKPIVRKRFNLKGKAIVNQFFLIHDGLNNDTERYEDLSISLLPKFHGGHVHVFLKGDCIIILVTETYGEGNIEY